MAVIRSNDASRIIQDAIALDLGDLTRQGEMMRRHALDQARAIIAAANEERERILAGAREEGLRRGHAEGLEKGRAEGQVQGRSQAQVAHAARLAELERAWAAALTDLEQQRDGMLRDARTDFLRLALQIAQRVTGLSIEQHASEAACAQLAGALSLLARRTKLVIRIHPDDRAALTQAMPTLAARFPAAEHAELADDPALPRGSCVLRTPAGEIDASINAQLDRIARAVLHLPEDAPAPLSPIDAAPSATSQGAGPAALGTGDGAAP